MLFHGTHINSLDGVLENGIKGNQLPGFEVRGSSFTSPKADVAFAYACMLGGEQSYHGHVKDADRVLLVLDIPAEWYAEHHVRDVDGIAPETSFDCDIPAEFIVDYVVGDRKAVYAYL